MLKFAVGLTLAIIFGWIDYVLHSTIFLTVYCVVVTVVIFVTGRKGSSRRYKFELVQPGVLRSPQGFEIWTSSSQLQYREGVRVVTWQPNATKDSVARFQLSEEAIPGWDPPNTDEKMSLLKKREIAGKMKFALVHLQLLETGRIKAK